MNGRGLETAIRKTINNSKDELEMHFIFEIRNYLVSKFLNKNEIKYLEE
jgi:hypothetical protein